MADAPCPSCGKPNPSDAQACQFCQALIPPDWLSDFRSGDLLGRPDETGEPAAGRFSEEESSFFSDEEQDWLADLAQVEGVQEDLLEPPAFEAPESEREPDLAPAELPGWLEAMRPVEAAAASPPDLDQNDRRIESSGPLSGMRGVLPVKRNGTRAKKTPNLSARLQVTEKQEEQASLFEELIQTEGQAVPIPTRPALPVQSTLRLLIFCALFLGIAWPAITGSQKALLPNVAPETYQANLSIESLDNGAPVLLAIDYQPGLAPEMDSAAYAVVDHLMRKGAYLALISTTPTGPVQAERLIGLVSNNNGHQYKSINQYANLGYIPGGPIGLLGFAGTPRRITPFTLDGGYAWQGTPLQAVRQLDQFSLVVVVTENPDTAQAWIEQIKPALVQTPLLMVVSAQIDPVVRPYYEGRPQQVSGMVVGLAGAASYEQLQGRPGPAIKYWDSFSLGTLVAVALILSGSVVNTILGFLAGDKPQQAGEETA